MIDLNISDCQRLGTKEFRAFDMAKYSKQLFGMFSGDEVKVSLRCENDMVGVFLDRFGKDIIICPDGPDHFTTTIPVAFSNQFLGWVFSLGKGVQVTGPDFVVERMQEETRRLMLQYLG